MMGRLVPKSRGCCAPLHQPPLQLSSSPPARRCCLPGTSTISQWQPRLSAHGCRWLMTAASRLAGVTVRCTCCFSLLLGRRLVPREFSLCAGCHIASDELHTPLALANSSLLQAASSKSGRQLTVNAFNGVETHELHEDLRASALSSGARAPSESWWPIPSASLPSGAPERLVAAAGLS